MRDRPRIKCYPREGIIHLDMGAHCLRNHGAVLVEKAIEKLKGKKKLFFIINCPKGGDFYAMLRIGSAFERHKHRFTTVVFGTAYSLGPVLFQFGERRIMTARSKLGLHQATLFIPEDTYFNAREFQELSLRVARIDAIQLQILSNRGRPIRDIFRLFEREAWLNAATAKRFNLTDLVIPEPKDVEDLIDFLGRLD